jgi:hypothetical protein
MYHRGVDGKGRNCELAFCMLLYVLMQAGALCSGTVLNGKCKMVSLMIADKTYNFVTWYIFFILWWGETESTC